MGTRQVWLRGSKGRGEGGSVALSTAVLNNSARGLQGEPSSTRLSLLCALHLPLSNLHNAHACQIAHVFLPHHLMFVSYCMGFGYLSGIAQE